MTDPPHGRLGHHSYHLSPARVVRKVAAVHPVELGERVGRVREVGVRRAELLEVVSVFHLLTITVGEKARRFVQTGVDDLVRETERYERKS